MKKLDELKIGLYNARNRAIRNSIKRQFKKHLPNHNEHIDGDVYDWEPDWDIVEQDMAEDEDYQQAQRDYVNYHGKNILDNVIMDVLQTENKQG